MLADKPTSFKPLFRHSMEMNVIKKGVLEVYGLKVIGATFEDKPENSSKKIEKSERIEPRRRAARSGSVAVSSFFPASSGSSRLEGSQNRTFSKQQQKYLDEFNKKPGQKVFVTVYRTCTEYFAVIYPLKMILSARLPINCINLRTSRLEKLEKNLIKLFFGLRNGEFAYSIVFKIVDNELQASNPSSKVGNFKKEIKAKKKNGCSVSSDDDEHSNDGHSNEMHKNVYLSSTDDEHESIEENNEENIVTFNFNDEHDNSIHCSDSQNFFVTWEDALSGKIDISADGELINNSKNEHKPSLNLLATNSHLPNNGNFGKTTTNSNLLTVRTDEHRRRLSLQTIPETDADI